jgi:hypothetical protein
MVEHTPLLDGDVDAILLEILLQTPCNGRTCFTGDKAVEFTLLKLVV